MFSFAFLISLPYAHTRGANMCKKFIKVSFNIRKRKGLYCKKWVEIVCNIIDYGSTRFLVCDYTKRRTTCGAC